MTVALAGYRTTIQDISADMLSAARTELASWADGRVTKGKLERDVAEDALSPLTWSTDVEQAAATADFVIEAATERLPVKTEIFRTLDRCAPDHAILTTNSPPWIPPRSPTSPDGLRRYATCTSLIPLW